MKQDLDEDTVNEIISRLRNPKRVMPTDAQIVEALTKSADARTVLWRLRIMGYAKRESQLALQRAVDRKVIHVGPDWILAR